MSVWQGTAKAALQLIRKARRLAPIAVVSAFVPRTLKLRVTEKLARIAIGSGLERDGATGGSPSTASVSAPARRLDPRYADQGVDLCGYVRGELGLGETVRGFARALAQSGFPFTLTEFEVPTPARAMDHSLADWLVQQPKHATGIYFVNPDQMLLARTHFETRRSAGRYIIGYWFWELEHFPDPWRDALHLVDEVWVASEFVRRSVARVTDKPVHLVPMPLDFGNTAPVGRRHFGLPDDRFVFLNTFDYHSYPLRKNPEGAIEAFCRAFLPGREDVCLFVKTLNADRLLDAHLRLMDKAGSDRRIFISDGHLQRGEVSALIACSDAYISLHRSEGLGLGMAEAMALGKPVIATGYSGNLDFMSQDDARLVDYRLVDVAPGAYPHWQGQRWAEPDVRQAAQFMRALADNRSSANLLGAAAAERIRRQYDPSACSLVAIDRLQSIAASRTKAVTGSGHPE